MSEDQRIQEKKITERAAQIAVEQGIPDFLARIKAAAEISRADAATRAARAAAMSTHCTEA